MDKFMTDNTLALQISTPVISSRDNVDLKSIFQLIEQETIKETTKWSSSSDWIKSH